MNNNNIRAIVIMYRGPEITDEGMKNVREYIATLLGIEIVPEGFVLDDTDIAKSIAASTVITANKNGAEQHTTTVEIRPFPGMNRIKKADKPNMKTTTPINVQETAPTGLSGKSPTQ